MKLEPRRIEAFLRDPGAVRLVLLHGDDSGLVRDRAMRLVKAVAGTVDDPFAVVELDRESVSSLPAEMMSQSLTGTRRVIRVREAGDGIAEIVRRSLGGPGTAFAILEAGSLPSRSKLRVLVEQASEARALACYPLDGAAAAAFVEAVLSAASVSSDNDAVRFLCEAAGGDQLRLRGEAEKLALFVGAGGRADLPSVMLSAGETGNLSVEDACFAATSGDIARTDRALETALAEGATAVGLLRAALMHLHRLMLARRATDTGTSVADAVKALRPPLYFRRVAAFSTAVAACGGELLGGMAHYVSETERACKRTSAPADPMVRHAFLVIARRCAAARRG